MTKADEILNLDVVGLASKLRPPELSPLEATDAYLDRAHGALTPSVFS